MKRQPSVFAATLMGGIMGSAITAAYMLLNDKENRQRLFTTLDSLLESTGMEDAIAEGRDRVEEVTQNVKDRASSLKDEARRMVEATAEATEDIANRAGQEVEERTNKDKDATAAGNGGGRGKKGG